MSSLLTKTSTPISEIFSIGGLALPGDTLLRLGDRHPTTTGLVRLAVTHERGAVVTAEPQPGYGHRAAEKLFEVRDYRSAIMLADRHDWWSAYSGELLLTLAVEHAMRLTPPPRAVALRTLLAEYYRLHSHLGFLSYLAAGELEVRLWATVDRLRIGALAWTGNRIHPMLCRVGGLACDAPSGWLAGLDAVLDECRGLAEALRAGLAKTERFSGLAPIDEQHCLDFGLSGPIARAAGLDLDRRASGYLAYPTVFRQTRGRAAGDAQARFEVLIDEVDASIGMIRTARALAEDTPSEVTTRLARRLKVSEGEHVAEVEAPWGIASCLLVSRGGQTPWRVALRTPSFANLSALGPALAGVPVEQLADAIASIGYTVGDADK